MNNFKITAGRMVLAAIISTSLVSGAYADIAPDFMQKLQSSDRPDADKGRDAARKPAEVMAELGVQAGWTIVDVSAGAGWYTEVQSAAVGQSGKVLMQGTRDTEAANAKAARLGNVEVVEGGMGDIPAGTADAALTAMNLHDQFNFRGEEGAQSFLADIFNVLKSGGVAAIIDHEGSAGMDNGDLHRMVAADAKRMLEVAGFEIVKESQVLNNPADDHTLSIRDESLARNTDRFLFIVRKP